MYEKLMYKRINDKINKERSELIKELKNKNKQMKKIIKPNNQKNRKSTNWVKKVEQMEDRKIENYENAFVLFIFRHKIH